MSFTMVKNTLFVLLVVRGTSVDAVRDLLSAGQRSSLVRLVQMGEGPANSEWPATYGQQVDLDVDMSLMEHAEMLDTVQRALHLQCNQDGSEPGECTQDRFMTICAELLEETDPTVIESICKSVICATAGPPDGDGSGRRQCRQTTYISADGAPIDRPGQPFENRQKCCPTQLTMEEPCTAMSRCPDNTQSVRAAALADLLWARVNAKPNIEMFAPLDPGNEELARSSIETAIGISADLRLEAARDWIADDGSWSQRLIRIQPGGSLLEPTPTEIYGLQMEMYHCSRKNRQRQAARDACNAADSCGAECTALQDICDRSVPATEGPWDPPDSRACPIDGQDDQLLRTQSCPVASTGRRRVQATMSCPFAGPESPASLIALQDLYANTSGEVVRLLSPPDWEGWGGLQTPECVDLDKTDEDEPDEQGDSEFLCPAGWQFDDDSAMHTCGTFTCSYTECCMHTGRSTSWGDDTSYTFGDDMFNDPPEQLCPNMCSFWDNPCTPFEYGYSSDGQEWVNGHTVFEENDVTAARVPFGSSAEWVDGSPLAYSVLPADSEIFREGLLSQGAIEENCGCGVGEALIVGEAAKELYLKKHASLPAGWTENGTWRLCVFCEETAAPGGYMPDRHTSERNHFHTETECHSCPVGQSTAPWSAMQFSYPPEVRTEGDVTIEEYPNIVDEWDHSSWDAHHAYKPGRESSYVTDYEYGEYEQHSPQDNDGDRVYRDANGQQMPDYGVSGCFECEPGTYGEIFCGSSWAARNSDILCTVDDERTSLGALSPARAVCISCPPGKVTSPELHHNEDYFKGAVGEDACTPAPPPVHSSAFAATSTAAIIQALVWLLL